jgi:hypothetical protein
MRETMKNLLPLAFVISLLGCESRPGSGYENAKRNFDDVVKAQHAELQWRLDDEVAAQIFDDGTRLGLNRYLTFRRCHEEPPTRDANKRVCAALQKRVADAEAKAEKQHAREKAEW